MDTINRQPADGFGLSGGLGTQAEQLHNAVIMTALCAFFLLLNFLYERCWYLASFQGSFLGRRAPWIEIANGLCLVALVVSLGFRWQAISSLGTFSCRLLLAFFVTISIPFVLNGIFVYHQPPVGLFRSWFWFSGLLLLVIFHLWDDGFVLYRYLFRTLVLVGVVVSVLAVAAVLLPPMRAMFDQQIVRERFGLVSIGRLGSRFVSLAFFFFLVRLLRCPARGAKYAFTIIGLVLTAANVFLVVLGRQLMLGIIIASLYFLLRHKRKLAPARTWLFVVGAGMLFTFLPFSSSLIRQTFASIFSAEADGGAFRSAQKRMEGIEFYFEEFRRSGWIGFGKISTAHNTQGNTIVEAIEEDNLFLVDLGFLGIFFQYGLPSAILLGAVLFTWIKDLSFLSKEGGEEFADMVITIELFLVSRAVILSSFFYLPQSAYFYATLAYIILSASKQVSRQPWELTWNCGAYPQPGQIASGLQLQFEKADS